MTDIALILSNLPRRKIEELETVTKRIVDTGKVEIIVLFGSYARGDYKEKRGKTQGKKSDYDILVVTPAPPTSNSLRWMILKTMPKAFSNGRWRRVEEGRQTDRTDRTAMTSPILPGFVAQADTHTLERPRR